MLCTRPRSWYAHAFEGQPTSRRRRCTLHARRRSTPREDGMQAGTHARTHAHRKHKSFAARRLLDPRHVSDPRRCLRGGVAASVEPRGICKRGLPAAPGTGRWQRVMKQVGPQSCIEPPEATCERSCNYAYYLHMVRRRATVTVRHQRERERETSLTRRHWQVGSIGILLSSPRVPGSPRGHAPWHLGVGSSSSAGPCTLGLARRVAASPSTCRSACPRCPACTPTLQRRARQAAQGASA
jgi:hypothetical protein